MAITTDNNDSGFLCGYNLLHDQIGEQKRAQMVRCQMRLESVRRELVIHCHDSRVVDKDINNRDIIPGVDVCSCIPHAFQGAQVNFQCADLYIRLGLSNLCCHLGQFIGIASGQDKPLRLGLGNGLDEEATKRAEETPVVRMTFPLISGA